MNSSGGINSTRPKANQNIQVYVRVRPLNGRERSIRSYEVVDVAPPKEIVVRNMPELKMSKKFTFDRTFGPDSRQSEVYQVVVAPLIEEVLAGYNCTVFAYGQTGTGKTHTMIGTECPELKSSWEDESMIGIIPRALSHLFDELRLMEVEFSMRISYLELYNEELCDLLSSEDSTKIRIFDDSTKKGSVIIQGLEEIPVHSKDDVYKLLEKGKERRKTATTLMNAQSSRSHTVFSILVHIRENGIDGEEMLKIGKLNLVDLAGSENISKAGNEKGIRTRETVNINQSLLTLGRVITALVERTPHIPYRESKLTRLLQESLGGRTKTSIIATISPGHKDLEETLSTLDYAHRAKNIQNKPEINQKLTKKTVLKEYTEEIDRLKRDLMASRDKNGIYLAEETYNDMHYKLDSQNKELNEKMLLIKALKDDMANKERIFNEVSLHLIEKSEELKKTEKCLSYTKTELGQTKKVLTTTKRRYKEKKYLLETHVKTEEALTDQATKLIEVADIATADTDQLHETIERRKDVDVKIQTACEKFVSKMLNTFDGMHENLKHLNSNHEALSQIIMEELTKNASDHKKFSSSAIDKLKSIPQQHSDSVAGINACLKKYATQYVNIDSEHKTLFCTIINEIKQKENDFKVVIEKQLSDITQYLNDQSSLLVSNCSKLSEKIAENNNMVSEFSTTASSRLKCFAEDAKASLQQDITAIANIIQNREIISNQRKTAVDALEIKLLDFIKDIRSLEQQDCAESTKLQQLSENVEQTSKKIVVNIESELNNLEHLNANSESNFKNLEYSISNIQTDANIPLEKSHATLSNIDENLIENNKYEMNIADKLEEMTIRHLDKTSEIVENIKTDTIAKGQSLNTQMENESKNLTDRMNTEMNRVVQYKTQNMALNKSLQNNVKEYTGNYNQKMSDCRQQLEIFQQHELKTYSPTGQTPSRKEFSYPRILAATSPHNNIIKRFRLDNEWSDLDTTATITEDSENTSQEMLDENLLINSTPIKSDVDCSTTEKLKNLQSEFNFKMPQLMIKADESSKNSPVLHYDKENKENFTP